MKVVVVAVAAAAATVAADVVIDFDIDIAVVVVTAAIVVIVVVLVVVPDEGGKMAPLPLSGCCVILMRVKPPITSCRPEGLIPEGE